MNGTSSLHQRMKCVFHPTNINLYVQRLNNFNYRASNATKGKPELIKPITFSKLFFFLKQFSILTQIYAHLSVHKLFENKIISI